MALQPEQLQQILIGTLGDETTPQYPSGVLASLLPLIWTLHAETITEPTVLFLSVKRDTIDVLIGAVRDQVQFADTDTGAAVFLQQKADALLKLRSDVVNDLLQATAAAKSGVSSGAPPRGGQLITRAPVSSPSPYLDANNSNYGGSPYRRGSSWIDQPIAPPKTPSS